MSAAQGQSVVRQKKSMTRRALCRSLLALPALKLLGQQRPESFRVYSETPRLLLRPARLKLLRRERERRSLRWDQFETLWTGGAPFPELGWAQALRYQLADDRESGIRAVAWAVGPGDDIRQIAIISDWCAQLISGDDRNQIFAKLRREISNPQPPRTLNAARNRLFAAIALSEAQPAASEKALQTIFDGFWTGSFIANLRDAKSSVSNADAYAMMEILHAFRDNLNFELRDTFPAWFQQYPLMHLLANYPLPFPGSENEYWIPADEAIDKSGPDVNKAVLSRAAELAMVAYDANAASSQLLQGWVTNDRFLMRGTLGISYELLWANPYQPGLSYYHAPLAIHDEIGGQLFVRSSWEEDAQWIGFFNGQLQLFSDGAVKQADPRVAREPLDIGTAVIFFAREAKRFIVPQPEGSAPGADTVVFIVGLQPKRDWHVEVDGEEMVEMRTDPGGILYLAGVPAASGVRLALAPATQ